MNFTETKAIIFYNTYCEECKTEVIKCDDCKKEVEEGEKIFHHRDSENYHVCEKCFGEMNK